MALEHALLVSLTERPGSGLELSRRFDRSIGLFWRASHQQIYRTLARMEADEWLSVTEVAQSGRPDKKEYAVAAAGARALADWIAAPGPLEQTRSDLAVRLRGASYGDRSAVLADVRHHRAEHATRLAAYNAWCARDYPDPSVLAGADLDQYLVLRGGVRLEEFWVGWLTEYLEAHAGRSAQLTGARGATRRGTGRE
jgi:DNA-binding PadR family transcriptional regulator